MPAETDMIGIGTTLSYLSTNNLWNGSTNVPSGTFVAVGSLLEVDSPELTADDVQTTSMDVANSTRTYRAGLADAGELSFTIKYFDTTSATLSSRFRITSAWKLTYPDGSGYGFDGYIKTLGGEVPIDDLITQNVTIKLTNTVIDLPAT